jgi:hypothetical protein
MGMTKTGFSLKFSKKMGKRFLPDKCYPVLHIETEQVFVPVNVEKKIEVFKENDDVDDADVDIKERKIKKELSMQSTVVVWLMVINELNKIELIDASTVKCYY